MSFRNERYNRQEMMPEWGPQRQQHLKTARVGVIGVGGVKSSLTMALTAGGIGFQRLIEFDDVELSNLNRQTLYRTSDVGRKKGEAALETLQDLNPGVALELFPERLVERNIAEALDDVDFVVEGGESPSGRNLVNEYCLDRGKPFVHASAQYSYGYVFSVVPEKRTACFACFFPNDHTRTQHTGPVPVNVLSVQLAGTLGATEVFKWFLGYQDRMTVNRRLCFSSLLLSGAFSEEVQERIPDCPVCSKYYL